MIATTVLPHWPELTLTLTLAALAFLRTCQAPRRWHNTPEHACQPAPNDQIEHRLRAPERDIRASPMAAARALRGLLDSITSAAADTLRHHGNRRLFTQEADAARQLLRGRCTPAQYRARMTAIARYRRSRR